MKSIHEAKGSAMDNVFVGTHNICFGKNAGLDLTNETYMFCLKLDGFKEFRMEMTQEEYEMLDKIFNGLEKEPENKQ